MRATLTHIGLPAGAILASLLLFGVFVWFAGVSPLDVWGLLFKGAFGDAYSWQNTLQRAAPLMLTALCVAVPARAGLVIIGGEGALVLGGLGFGRGHRGFHRLHAFPPQFGKAVAGRRPAAGTGKLFKLGGLNLVALNVAHEAHGLGAFGDQFGVRATPARLELFLGEVGAAPPS